MSRLALAWALLLALAALGAEPAAQLAVTTQPAGAEVRLNGVRLGLTPLLYSLPLPGGTPRPMRLEVFVDGTVERSAEITLGPGETFSWIGLVTAGAPSVPAPSPSVVVTPAPPAEPGVVVLPPDWPAYLRDYRPPRADLRFRVAARDGMPQVLIPAGSFTMGDTHGDGAAEERPARRVQMSAYWIDLHEVTNEQFRRFVEATGYQPSPAWLAAEPAGPLWPAAGIAWRDAAAYATWAGRSLPTEAQWERAARGGFEGRRYPWGDLPSTEHAAAGWGDRQASLRPVSQDRPGGFGLLGTVGGVWEWCLDTWLFDAYLRLGAADPVSLAGEGVHVRRGGSWRSPAAELRTAARGRGVPEGAADPLLAESGFRCASAP